MTSATASTGRRTTALLTSVLMIASVLVALAPGRALAATGVLADFEGGVPAGWFEYSGGGAALGTTVTVISDTDTRARPGQVGDDSVLDADFGVTSGWAGFGTDFAVSGGPQDWTAYAAVRFWMFGTGSGNTYQFEIQDNRSTADVDTAERFDTTFTDDFEGWQLIEIPFSQFTRAIDYQPSGALDDGLTLTEMWGWAIPLDGNAGTLTIDDVTLVADAVQGFENGLPAGSDGNGNAVGFSTFSDSDSSVAISVTTTPPAAVPGSQVGNAVLEVETDVNDSNGFAGVIEAFTNATADAWVPRDWSDRAGISFWLYGNNTGEILFFDLLDNRTEGSTGDTAERWSTNIVDDFEGWQLITIPFDSLGRKEIGNGAPNDGLTLTEVHGWAFGVFDSGRQFVNYLDDVALFGVREAAPLSVQFSAGITEITEGTTGDVAVKLNRPFVDGDPAEVRVTYTTEPGTAEPGRDYTPSSGELVFTPDTPTELTFPIETFGDDKFLGNQRIVLRLSDPVGVELGTGFQASAIIVDDDPYDPRLVDDFEHGAYLFEGDGLEPAVTEVTPGDPLAVPDQGAFESILQVETPVLGPEIPVVVDVLLPPRGFCGPDRSVVPVAILTTASFDATTIDHTTVRVGDAMEAHTKGRGGPAQRHEDDVEGDGDLDLLVHVRVGDSGYGCDTDAPLLTGETFAGQPIASALDHIPSLARDFTLPQDWSRDDAISFWFYGSGGGDAIGVTLKDNAAPDPGPQGWQLAWSDEFEGAAGTAPNEANWTHEIGDVTPDGKNGWGNSELQYYTDSTDNAAHDGAGNLVITLRENEDPSLQCYYGPCEYTSARLLTWHKSEFAYGRVETSLKLPTYVDDADDLRGLWPAFWSLGADIDRTPWPAAGEIDIMEWVGRIPDEIFGTIHGPGYSGGQSFGDTSALVDRDAFHEFAIEWEPEEIRWYLDGVLYHAATPADVAPNEWVFDKPFFLLLNFAIGGNFGGEVGDGVQFPQEYVVDYVRMYEAPDTAERFEASFTDDVAGWQQVTIPFSAFVRSDDQPAGAPDDGLTLDEVNGYGFRLLDGGTSSGWLRIDQVRRIAAPAPTEFEVTTLEDGPKGSLRDALGYVADGGRITFAPELTGGTLSLTRGPLEARRDVTIDGAGAPGLSVDGGGRDRVLIVESGAAVSVTDLTLSGGYGWQLAGCVLNNGDLRLERVTVTGCTMATDAGDFWQGGGGIYSGDGATLNLIDSTVSANSSGHDGGGVFSFLNTRTTIVGSTISGNTASNVGGGLRLLGDTQITDSVVSGNVAVAWHGAALFLTDGVLDVSGSSITENSAVGSAAIFVGTFGAGSATMNIGDSTVTANVSYGCFLAPWGAGTVAINSLGGNTFQDDTCYPVEGDVIESAP